MYNLNTASIEGEGERVGVRPRELGFKYYITYIFSTNRKSFKYNPSKPRCYFKSHQNAADEIIRTPRFYTAKFNLTQKKTIPWHPDDLRGTTFRFQTIHLSKKRKNGFHHPSPSFSPSAHSYCPTTFRRLLLLFSLTGGTPARRFRP